MKTIMNELLDWINEFNDKPIKPTYINMKEKIWQLLPKERDQILASFNEGYRSAEKHSGISKK